LHASGGAPPTSPRSFFPLPLLPLQRKLAIGSTTDSLEAEADRVADRVMGMSAPSPQSVASGAAPAIRRKCACEGSGSECPECQKKKEEKLQRKVQSPLQAQLPAPVEAPPIVHQVLRSPGQQLDSATRSFFEPRLGHDLSHVRVHTDAEAAESAHAVQALAYAVGDNVAFAAGQYSPHSTEGRRLLAHELAHVAQQRSGAATEIQRKPQSGADVKLAHSRGQAVVEKLEKAGKLSKGMRIKINRDLRFFKGAAKRAYLSEVKPELIEVGVSLFPDNSGIIPSANDIELGAGDPTAEMTEDFGSVSDDDIKAGTVGEGKNSVPPQESPRYIDNLFESVDQKSLNGAVTFHWKEGGKEKKQTIAAADLNQNNPNSTLADIKVYESKAEALKGAERTAQEFGSMASFYYSYYETNDGVIMPTSFFQGSTPKLYALWPDLAKLAQMTAENWDDDLRGLGILANTINPFPCTQVDEKGQLSPSINLGNCALPILLHGYAIHSATRGPGLSGPKSEPNMEGRSGRVPDQVEPGSPSTVNPETKPAPTPPKPRPAEPIKPAAKPPVELETPQPAESKPKEKPAPAPKAEEKPPAQPEPKSEAPQPAESKPKEKPASAPKAEEKPPAPAEPKSEAPQPAESKPKEKPAPAPKAEEKPPAQPEPKSEAPKPAEPQAKEPEGQIPPEAGPGTEASKEPAPSVETEKPEAPGSAEQQAAPIGDAEIDKIGQLEAENSKLSDEIEAAKPKLKAAQAKYDEAEKTVDSLENDVKGREAYTKKAAEDNPLLKDQVEYAERQRAKLKSARKNLARAKEKLDPLKNQQSAREAKWRANRAEIEKLARPELLLEPTLRGVANELRVLKDEGLLGIKKSFTVKDPKTGELVTTIPDGMRPNGSTVDVKDVAELSETSQLRAQKVVSARSGQKAEIITGVKTKVSATVEENYIVKRRPDLGPR
jgi:hypothetical protein